MRYTERFRMESIPEWRSCYLNYERLKVQVKMIRDSVRERLELSDVMAHGSNLQARTQRTISLNQIGLPS